MASPYSMATSHNMALHTKRFPIKHGSPLNMASRHSMALPPTHSRLPQTALLPTQHGVPKQHSSSQNMVPHTKWLPHTAWLTTQHGVPIQHSYQQNMVPHIAWLTTQIWLLQQQISTKLQHSELFKFIQMSQLPFYLSVCLIYKRP